MKTRIIILLLSLITLNVMGQGTIIHKKTTATKPPMPTSSAKKTAFSIKKNASAKTTDISETSDPTLGNSNYEPCIKTINVNDISLQMVEVQGGTFLMGATREQETVALVNEMPKHKVTLSSFYISKYEVTQDLWTAIMGFNPSHFKGENLPVELISWNDCQTFINKLNSITGKNFRLPTEAEWEFAARGGTKSRGYKYSGSNDLSEVAWYEENSRNMTHAVGTKQPNELGLYDMSGNVYEWCQDGYGSYSNDAQIDPVLSSDGLRYVNRGGSWYAQENFCRASYRSNFSYNSCYGTLGLRLACSNF